MLETGRAGGWQGSCLAGVWRAASLGIRPVDGPKLGGGKPETLQMELPLSSLAGARVWLVPGTTIQERALHASCQGAMWEVGTAILCLLGFSSAESVEVTWF